MTPEGSSQMAVALNNLATVYDHHEDFVAAEALFRESLAMRIAVAMPERDIARARFNLVRPLLALGKVDEADELASQALEVNRRQHGSTWSEQVGTLLALARIALARGQVGLARERLEAARAVHADAAAWSYLHSVAADVVLAEGDRAQARELLESFAGGNGQAASGRHIPRLLSQELRLLALADDPAAAPVQARLAEMEPGLRAHYHPDGPAWQTFRQLRAPAPVPAP